MSPGVRNTLVASVAFVAAVLGMFYHSVTRPPVLNTADLQQRGVIALPHSRALAPFELTDQHGEPFTRDSLMGRWSFVFFGFTSCPDVCPLALAALSQVEQRLAAGDEQELRDAFNVILVTVDPERDDAATLGRYVEAFSDNFIGVFGNREDTAAFAQQLNVAFMKVPTGDGQYSVDHTGNIVVINPRGEYHGFIKMPHEPDTLVLGYRSLVAGF